MFDHPSFSTCSENSKRSWDQALRASRRDLCIDLDSISDSGAESLCKSKKTDIFTAEASKGSGWKLRVSVMSRRATLDVSLMCYLD